MHTVEERARLFVLPMRKASTLQVGVWLGGEVVIVHGQPGGLTASVARRRGECRARLPTWLQAVGRAIIPVLCAQWEGTLRCRNGRVKPWVVAAHMASSPWFVTCTLCGSCGVWSPGARKLDNSGIGNDGCNNDTNNGS